MFFHYDYAQPLDNGIVLLFNYYPPSKYLLFLSISPSLSPSLSLSLSIFLVSYNLFAFVTNKIHMGLYVRHTF